MNDDKKYIVNEDDAGVMPHLSSKYLRQAKAELKNIKKQAKEQKEGRHKQELMGNGFLKIMNFLDRNIHKNK